MMRPARCNQLNCDPLHVHNIEQFCIKVSLSENGVDQKRKVPLMHLKPYYHPTVNMVDVIDHDHGFYLKTNGM